LLLAELPQRRKGALQIAVGRKDRQERRSDLLERHPRLAAALEDERAAPRQPILAEPACEFDEGTRIFRPDHHVDAGVFILADLDPLASVRHGVDPEDLATQRRPQETFLAGLLDVILG